MDSLATAELIIYILFSLPVLFVLVRHMPEGLMGWGYLFAFCAIRLVAGALTMKSTNTAGSTISNVGLSPLLLTLCGILHEARVYRFQNLDRKREFIFLAAFHILVAGGIALLAAGSAGLQNSHTTKTNLVLVDVGIAILTTAWCVLIGWTSLTFSSGRIKEEVASAPRASEGTVLLYAVSISLSFVGIRLIYTLVALTTRKPTLNPATGSLVIRVVLSFLPELIATLVLLVAGLFTQNVGQRETKESQNANSTSM